MSGPRQSGKTTLVRKIAGEDFNYYTFDDITTRDAARNDPVGFIKQLDRAIIDEVQRVPDILLAIKSTVDIDKRPGRFLLTGSANLHSVPQVADSLAGRMETIQLLPLAQVEIQECSPFSWLDKIFNDQIFKQMPELPREHLVQTVFAGGYPEAKMRSRWHRRSEWYHQYIDSILKRDIQDVARIEQLAALPGLLRMLGQYSGQLVNYSKLGAPLDLNHVTTRKYVSIFESLFLIHTLQPWHSNQLKRLVKTPKLHFYDSGLLAALSNLTPGQVLTDRTKFGSMLETFIFGELVKHASWSMGRYIFSHYRDKDKKEIDFVIEDANRNTIGIEVKAASTVTHEDFAGLKVLAKATGKNFKRGIVLYDHHETIPFGDKLTAMPISTLWA